MRIVFVSTKRTLTLTNTWASLYCVSHDIYANFALDTVSGNGNGQIRLPIVRTPAVLRLSTVKSHKLDEASVMSIAAQASIGPRRWHGSFGAKKRCAECTYLRLSPLPSFSRVWRWPPFPHDDCCKARSPAFISFVYPLCPCLFKM